MWKLVFELKNDRGEVVNRTILYVLEEALIGQPIFAAASASALMQAHTDQKNELAKFYMLMLIASLHKTTFQNQTDTPSEDTAVFIMDAIILDDPNNLLFTVSYFDGITRQRTVTRMSFRDFYNGLSSYHTKAFATIDPDKISREDESKAPEPYERPTAEQNIKWLEMLTLSSNQLLPEKFIEYLPVAENFDYDSSVQVGDYVKFNVIIALYNAAIEYYRVIWEETIEKYDFKAFIDKRNSFNEKFQGIAQIHTNGSMSSLADAFASVSYFKLTYHQDNNDLERLIDKLLKRCANHDAWTQDGGRAYFFALKHLYDMDSKLCVGAFSEITKPDKRFFNIIRLERLPPYVRGLATISYKDTAEPVLRFFGVVGENSRFTFTSFANAISDARDDQVKTRIIERSTLMFDDYDGNRDDHSLSPPSRRKRQFIAQRNTSNVPIPDANAPDVTIIPTKRNWPIKQSFRNLIDKISRFMATKKFDRILIGIGIGAGIAVIAAVFVTITFFSGGTFIPVAAAAAGVAAMSGAGGMIATMLSGIALFSFLGGLFGYVAHKKIEKNKATRDCLSEVRSDADAEYEPIGASSSEDICDRLNSSLSDSEPNKQRHADKGGLDDQSDNDLRQVNANDISGDLTAAFRQLAELEAAEQRAATNQRK